MQVHKYTGVACAALMCTAAMHKNNQLFVPLCQMIDYNMIIIITNNEYII